MRAENIKIKLSKKSCKTADGHLQQVINGIECTIKDTKKKYIKNNHKTREQEYFGLTTS